MARPFHDEDEQVLTHTRAKEKLARPPLYSVLLHNDDYTTRDFVVLVLTSVFHKPENEAVTIMLHVHTKGIGVAGVYPFDVAETKVSKVAALAAQAQMPLLCTMEPVDETSSTEGF